MASFNREKYRAVPLSTVASTVQSTKQYDTYYGGKSDYAPFFKNRDGVVVKRVLPAHEPGDSPYVPMMTSMLDCEVEEKKDGVVVGKKIAKKKIFLATLHAGARFDIIEEYIKRVYELAEQYQDKEEKARFLNPITGYRMGKQWVSGIRPQLEYVFYAYIDGQVYRDTLRPKQMEALNKESAELCAQNDTVAVDMFSDPNSGFPIQWSRGKDDAGKTVETIKALPLPMNMSWADYFEKYAVSDKVLEELEKYPSLKSLYVDSYRKRDFELALDGLKRFDEKNGYGIFAQEDYLDMIEELEAFIDKKFGDAAASETQKSASAGTSTPAAAPVAAPKAVAKKTVKKAEPAGVTTEQKLAVINAEFVQQYGDDYDALTEDMFDSAAQLEETYQLALKHEDLGYGIEHVEGWVAGRVQKKVVAPKAPKTESPKPTAEPVAATPKEPVVEQKPPVSEGVQPVEGVNTSEGMTALERIRAMREKRNQK